MEDFVDIRRLTGHHGNVVGVVAGIVMAAVVDGDGLSLCEYFLKKFVNFGL